MTNRRIAWPAMLVLFLIVVLSGSCAPTLKGISLPSGAVAEEARVQRELAMRTQIANDNRLARVHFRVVKAAGNLCPRKRMEHGLRMHQLSAYAPEQREFAASTLGAGERLTIRFVIPGSRAATAGLSAGDTVVAIGGKEVRYRSVDQAQALLSGGAPGTSLAKDLTVLRRGTPKSVPLEAESVCDCPAFVVPNDIVNAYADGKRIMVTSGMLNFAAGDDDLAVVVGHEIAHNALGHITKRRVNSFLGSLVDVGVQIGTGIDTFGIGGNVGSMVFSKAFEGEADYLGAYLAARAGYNLQAGPALWRRMAKDHPNDGRSTFFSSHPTNPERFVALDLIAKEIEKKRAGGKALEPDRKSVASRSE